VGVPWPAAVPDCPAPGNTRQRTDARLRTPTDAGPAIVRRRFSATPINLSWTIPALTGAQVQALEAFYIVDLQEGSLRVDLPDVVTGLTVECRFLTPPRFSGLVPNPNATERMWRAQLELEIMP